MAAIARTTGTGQQPSPQVQYPVISCHILSYPSYPVISLLSFHIHHILSYLSYPYIKISTVDTTSQCQIHVLIYELILM